MKILAFEWSTDRKTVALGTWSSGQSPEGLQAEQSGRAPWNIREVVLGLLGEFGWKLEDLEGLAVGLGPGSYTGIRSAIALAYGWSFPQDLPLFGISSLEVMAHQVLAEADLSQASFACCMDAQRGEWYWQEFDGKGSHASTLSIQGPAWVADRIHQQNLPVYLAQSRKPAPEGAMIRCPAALTLIQMLSKGMEQYRVQDLTPIYLRPVSFVKSGAVKPLPE